MSESTKIQWTDATWNPTRGCSIVSAGCSNCYAMRQAHRFAGPGGKFEGLTRRYIHGPKWTGKVRLVPEVLDQPLRWRKPRRIFVDSMSDLFHEDVTDEFIDLVFAIMAFAERHTFQLLTKRPDRMREYLNHPNREEIVVDAAESWLWEKPERWRIAEIASETQVALGRGRFSCPWPLANVWLGVSCEDQAAADERIPLLLQTPAAVRFVSCEPLLEGVTLFNLRDGSWHDREGADWYNALAGHAYWSDPADGGLGGGPKLDWVIVGGESGPRARPCDVSWIRSIVGQCRDAGVACFVKQVGADARDRNDTGFEGVDPGEWPDGTETEEIPGSIGWQGDRIRVCLRSRAGSDPSEWPEDLRVREWPR